MAFFHTSSRHVDPWVLGLLACFAFAACNHDDDLDRLSMNLPQGGTPSTGDGDGDGDGGGGGGDGDGGGGGDGDGDGSAPADFCLPCPDPPEGADDWEACCTGPANRFCGFRASGEAGSCLRLGVVGNEDPGCPTAEVDLGDGPVEVPGCCRPDGHCGVVLPGVDGCIDSTQVPARIGGPFLLRLCTFPCADDSDCGGAGNGFICTERDMRVCARECLSDLDCVREEVCALRNNEQENRVESVCQEPLGNGGVGEPCGVATDCASGTCSGPPMGERACSRLCRTSEECGGALDRCGDATIPTPNEDGTQVFRICK